MVGLDIAALREARTTVQLTPAFEHAVLVLTGELHLASERLQPGTLLYLGCGRDQISLRSGAPAHCILIGGEPFKEEILLWWNFVCRTREELVKATEDWNARRCFGEVKGSPSPRLVAPELANLNPKAS